MLVNGAPVENVFVDLAKCGEKDNIMTDALTQIETFRTSPQEVSIVVCMQQTMCALSSVSNDDTFGVHWQIQSKVYRCNQSSAPQRNIAKTLDFDANM